MPVTIESLKGRMLDTDSHLQVPFSEFPTAFGPVLTEGLRRRYARLGRIARDKTVKTDLGEGLTAGFQWGGTPADEPTPDNVWTLKMHLAPGSFDAAKRLKTLDLMGVDRQILFPMAVPAAFMLSAHADAAATARRHNDYVLEWSAAAGAGGRLRPVAVINMDDVAGAIAEAERVIAKGAYSVNIGCGRPPAGLSPADPAWDPFWALFAETGVPVLLHIGGEVGMTDPMWGRTENLVPGKGAGALDGESVGPFSLMTMPFGPQAFLSAMILDGCLDRHPGLRLGVIEMTAQWVGPMAEALDQKLAVFGRLSKHLALKPSEYLRRQVRVTPFWWEPIGLYIDRYGLEDVYVFSTDFPHVEGGTEPVEKMFASLAGHSDSTIEKFFVTNGALLV